MDKKTVELFALYNEETNRKMNGIITGLTPQQWKQEFKGFFPSIKILCNHIYIGDYIWMKRFGSFRDYRFAENDIFNREMRLTDTIFESTDEYIRHRILMDAIIKDFASETSTQDLSADLNYKDTRGNEHSKSFGGLVLHMFNHQTHHRGMISLYLEELGIANDFSNLFALL